MALPAFATERRAVAPLLLDARRPTLAALALSSKPAARHCCD